jgi:hypothetical protein
MKKNISEKIYPYKFGLRLNLKNDVLGYDPERYIWRMERQTSEKYATTTGYSVPEAIAGCILP